MNSSGQNIDIDVNLFKNNKLPAGVGIGAIAALFVSAVLAAVAAQQDDKWSKIAKNPLFVAGLIGAFLALAGIVTSAVLLYSAASAVQDSINNRADEAAAKVKEAETKVKEAGAKVEEAAKNLADTETTLTSFKEKKANQEREQRLEQCKENVMCIIHSIQNTEYQSVYNGITADLKKDINNMTRSDIITALHDAFTEGRIKEYFNSLTESSSNQEIGIAFFILKVVDKKSELTDSNRITNAIEALLDCDNTKQRNYAELLNDIRPSYEKWACTKKNKQLFESILNTKEEVDIRNFGISIKAVINQMHKEHHSSIFGTKDDDTYAKVRKEMSRLSFDTIVAKLTELKTDDTQTSSSAETGMSKNKYIDTITNAVANREAFSEEGSRRVLEAYFVFKALGDQSIDDFYSEKKCDLIERDQINKYFDKKITRETKKTKKSSLGSIFTIIVAQAKEAKTSSNALSSTNAEQDVDESLARADAGLKALRGLFNKKSKSEKDKKDANNNQEGANDSTAKAGGAPADALTGVELKEALDKSPETAA